MSVKHAILALLYDSQRHGYEVLTGFDELVQKKWPLNPGQVYTTLDRLERDEWVQSPGQDENDRKIYVITEKGKHALHQWLNKPVERSFLKDEFYFKWLCAKKVEYQQQTDMVKQQREVIIKEILHLTQFKQQLKHNDQEAMLVLVEGALLHLEADLKWMEIILKNE